MGRLAYSARNSDKTGHCSIALRANRGTIFDERRGNGVLAAVLILDIKLMLKELWPRG